MMHEFSEIAKSSINKSPEETDHPVSLGPQSQIHKNCKLGRYSFINSHTVIYPHSSVGRYCSIARNVEIGVANHPTGFLSTHTFQYSLSYFPRLPGYAQIRRRTWRSHPPTLIGNDVWVGAKAIVRAGVTVGDGAIIASGSVVTKNVAPYAIVGGVPAKLIRYRFSQDLIKKLLLVKWWELEVADLDGLPFDDVDECIRLLLELRGIQE